jgi:hypothetical protein
MIEALVIIAVFGLLIAGYLYDSECYRRHVDEKFHIHRKYVEESYKIQMKALRSLEERHAKAISQLAKKEPF